LRVVKVEQAAGGIEVIYSNGIKEEIENGRFERKDASGRTVVERRATQADLARIRSNVSNSGLQSPQTSLPGGSEVRSVEVSSRAIEVRYATGWKEEIEGGRYEMKDPNNNTVVERRATQADVDRMRSLAGR
jgi:hypothetical protein